MNNFNIIMLAYVCLSADSGLMLWFYCTGVCFLCCFIYLFIFLTGNQQSDGVTLGRVVVLTVDQYLILTAVGPCVSEVHIKDFEVSRVVTWCLSAYKWSWVLFQNECSFQKLLSLRWDQTSDGNVLTPCDLTNRMHGDIGLWGSHWKTNTIITC